MDAGAEIIGGVWAGCKNYSLKIRMSNNTITESVKVRGLTLDNRTKENVNYDKMRDSQLAKANSYAPVMISRPEIKRKNIGEVSTRNAKKTWRPVHNKSREHDSVYVPFGYKS